MVGSVDRLVVGGILSRAVAAVARGWFVAG